MEKLLKIQIRQQQPRRIFTYFCFFISKPPLLSLPKSSKLFFSCTIFLFQNISLEGTKPVTIVVPHYRITIAMTTKMDNGKA